MPHSLVRVSHTIIQMYDPLLSLSQINPTNPLKLSLSLNSVESIGEATMMNLQLVILKSKGNSQQVIQTRHCYCTMDNLKSH